MTPNHAAHRAVLLCLQGMAHLDVKSSNVLLTSGGVAKLADVGLSRMQTRTYLSALPMVGTFDWWALQPSIQFNSSVSSQLFNSWGRSDRWHPSGTPRCCATSLPACLLLRCSVLNCSVPPGLAGLTCRVAPEVLMGGKNCTQAVDL